MSEVSEIWFQTGYIIGFSLFFTASNVRRVYQKTSGDILLILAGLGAIMVGIFPMDSGLSRTFTGSLHTVGALLQFAIFPIAVSIIGFKVFQGWAGIYTRTTGILTLSLFFIIFTLYFFVKGVTIFGLIEKIDIALIAGWSFVVPYGMLEQKKDNRFGLPLNSDSYSKKEAKKVI